MIEPASSDARTLSATNATSYTVTVMVASFRLDETDVKRRSVVVDDFHGVVHSSGDDFGLRTRWSRRQEMLR